MGIRRKILVGFLLLAGLLFFSGLMSFFELRRLSKSTQEMIDDRLKNMEASNTMLDAIQDQNMALIQNILGDTANINTILYTERGKFDEALKSAAVLIRDLPVVDSIYTSNLRFNAIVDRQLLEGEIGKVDMAWFTTVYKTSYYELKDLVKQFMISSQNVIDDNATILENNAYRATTPGIVTLGIAILIIFMFFYFIDVYYIKPVYRLTAGLNNYLNFKIPFKVTVTGRDELLKLKEQIEELVERLKMKKE